jgi:hypothetical protein
VRGSIMPRKTNGPHERAIYLHFCMPRTQQKNINGKTRAA